MPTPAPNADLVILMPVYNDWECVPPLLNDIDALPAGRTATLSDPQGGPFALWEPGNVVGAGLVNDDMASHLLIADYVQEPSGFVPSFIRGGYPIGPHAVVVALDGWVDAGSAATAAAGALAEGGRVIATFDADSIFDYRYDDFEIAGYQSHPAIKAPIAV